MSDKTYYAFEHEYYTGSWQVIKYSEDGKSKIIAEFYGENQKESAIIWAALLNEDYKKEIKG